MDPAVAPVRPDQRIESLDVLRGFSLLGILLMNIVSFGLPFAAYTDPSIYGGADGANLGYWFANQVLFEGKMRAIFSMLFGASVIVMTSRAEARGAGIELADIYYRRTLWLIFFGILHAYFLWYGDILYAYGVVGLALFPLRKLKGRNLAWTGTFILLLHSLQGIGGMFHFGELQKSISEAKAAKAAGKPLTEKQTADVEEWDKLYRMFKPDPKAVEKEIQAHRGGYLAAFQHRAPIAASFQSDIFYRFMVWDVAGMLILGMGLMKLGVFDGSRTYRFYAAMAATGYGIGIPLNWVMGDLWMRSNFDFVSYFGHIMATSDLGRFSIAAGHIGLLVLLCKAGALAFVTQALSKVGRMALSNYLLTSLLCTLFFDGWGLGYFAKLQRFQLLYVVMAVWAICLVFSAAWLRHFQFGPVEWAWRSLTYRKKQPMRRAEALSADRPVPTPA